MKPYGIVSDIHAHAWSAFASTGAYGLNSRLEIILQELVRAANELKAAGGHVLFIAGDLFHTRGSIDPEVFNPTHIAIKAILNSGVSIYAIPGNHDLKGKETTELGNAIQTMGALEDFEVITKPMWPNAYVPYLAMVPWRSDLKQLRADILELSQVAGGVADSDLIIHAGIDGVITGMPDHGLTASELAGYGFKRVFAGHYHHHKVMEGGKVVSIGALTHQTWSDVGSNAGFLLVYPDRVEYRASHAPRFVDITSDTDADDVPLIVPGNYVRVRDMKLQDHAIKNLREELTKMGALGVSIQVARETVSERTGGIAKVSSIEESVGNYIDSLSVPEALAVKTTCNDILTSIRCKAA